MTTENISILRLNIYTIIICTICSIYNIEYTVYIYGIVIYTIYTLTDMHNMFIVPLFLIVQVEVKPFAYV